MTFQSAEAIYTYQYWLESVEKKMILNQSAFNLCHSETSDT